MALDILADPGTTIRAGHPRSAAFVETAYADHYSGLVRRLTALTRDPGTAEELAQEAFTRLAEQARAGRRPDNAGAWVHRVGVNLVVSRGRRLQVADRRRHELVEPANAPSPEAAVIALDDARRLRSALAELRVLDRDVLLLAAQGLGGPEIARRLRRTEGATRTLLCRARMRLRDQLAAGDAERRPNGGRV